MTSLSIIVPTVGRSLLRLLLEETSPQLGQEDEVLVVGDGHQPAAQEIVRGKHPGIRYYEHEPNHCWGHPQRNWAMRLARGTHIAFFDDDDALLPETLSIMRRASERFPDRPIIFKMRNGPDTLWKERSLACGNVSTQMFLVPKLKGRLGRWGDRYEGDLDFIRTTVALYPKKTSAIVWREELIVLHGIGGKNPRP